MSRAARERLLDILAARAAIAAYLPRVIKCRSFTVTPNYVGAAVEAGHSDGHQRALS
jgi:hypothetical protein